MAMGYAGNSAEVISFEEVEKLGLDSYEKLKEKTKEMDFDAEVEMADMVIHHMYDSGKYTDEEARAYLQVYDDFTEDFKEQTGIHIEFQYHDSQNHGDIYDGVDGLYFSLNPEDIYKMKPMAKELKERLGFEMGYYVYYG